MNGSLIAIDGMLLAVRECGVRIVVNGVKLVSTLIDV